MRGTQAVLWVSDDEQAEIEATVVGRFSRNDYGVEGSPVWDELEDCSVEWPISVNNEDVHRHVMVFRIGEEETKNLEESLCGLIKDDAWDMEEME